MSDYPVNPLSTTLSRFITKMRREVETFCLTCRCGGFDEAKCSNCDLYILASGLSNESCRIAWCENCDFIGRKDIEAMLECGKRIDRKKSGCDHYEKDGCLGCEFARFRKAK